MKFAIYVAASAAMFLSACATAELHPWKRPLTADQAGVLGATNLSLVEASSGVVAGWLAQDGSTYAASQGLIAVLVVAAMDGSANAGPMEAAQRTADELAKIAPVEMISKSLTDHMKGVTVSETYKVRYGDIVTRQKLGLSEKEQAAPDDTIELTVNYILSQDTTALRAVGTAVYTRADAKYVTPYTFKTVPEGELSGPLYRNTFIYESNRVSTPPPPPELKARWSQEIRNRYIKRRGKVPTLGDAGYGAFLNEITEANNDTLTPDEMTRAGGLGWTINNGAALLDELQSAHAFFAKYLLLDLNSTTVPKLDGYDDILETLPDGRVIRLVGAGGGAGSYVSSPGHLSTPATWGNAVQIAKVNGERAHEIGEAVKKAKAGK